MVCLQFKNSHVTFLFVFYEHCVRVKALSHDFNTVLTNNQQIYIQESRESFGTEALYWSKVWLKGVYGNNPPTSCIGHNCLKAFSWCYSKTTVLARGIIFLRRRGDALESRIAFYLARRGASLMISLVVFITDSTGWFKTDSFSIRSGFIHDC